MIYIFNVWLDLMTNSFEAYSHPWTDNTPEQECAEIFWESLNNYYYD